jgi:hypothetical protein
MKDRGTPVSYKWIMEDCVVKLAGVLRKCLYTKRLSIPVIGLTDLEGG